MTASTTTSVFGYDITITYSVEKSINELLIDADKTIEIIDPNLKSSVYTRKQALYFFKKVGGGFDYFYFSPNQIFFLNDSVLCIPDFVASKIENIRLILKERILQNKIKKMYLDPLLTTKCFLVDCTVLEDLYILLQILGQCKNESVTFIRGNKIVNNTNLLPAYGKKLLTKAEQAFKDLAKSKKRMSEAHHISLENWLNHKESTRAYVGKIDPKFESFHQFQRECILLCANSLKSTSIYLGFLFDLFMGSGKTILACVWLDYLRDYSESKIKYIIITPKGVIPEWHRVLPTFDLSHLVIGVYTWDAWNKIKADIKTDENYFVVADEAHYAYGDSMRNEEFYQLLNRDNVLGSVQLTGTPYSGKASQLPFLARCVGHYWGKYPYYFSKQLESIENVSELVKENLQDCMYSLTLDQALEKYPDFKIPKLSNELIEVDMTDPAYNGSYLEQYADCLAKVAWKLKLDSVEDIKQAMQRRGDNMKASHMILAALELIKADWIARHSVLPSMMLAGEKMVFFTKYRETAKKLYSLLSPLNDAFHLTTGNYTIKPRGGLNIATLQLEIGKLESEIKELLLSNVKSDHLEQLQRQVNDLKKERAKISFTKAVLSKSSDVLNRMNPEDLKAIQSGEWIIDTYCKALIIGGVPDKNRKLAMDTFNELTSDCKFIVLSIDAGGTGVNLHRSYCKLAFHLGIGTNYRTYQQSLSRIRRYGSEADLVTMNLLSVVGNTDQLNLEESLMSLYSVKHNIVNNIKSQSLEQTALFELSDEEILSRASKNMGFDDYILESADAKLQAYRATL